MNQNNIKTAKQVKDISDYLIVLAYDTGRKLKPRIYPDELLMKWTGACEKVCFRAMERAVDKDLIEYGVSLRTGWLTEKGEELLNAS